jgi:hypothetical protein
VSRSTAVIQVPLAYFDPSNSNGKETAMSDKPECTPHELKTSELETVSGGAAASDFDDLVKLVIHFLTGGGPVTGKGPH